jgi:hypothetical protein
MTSKIGIASMVLFVLTGCTSKSERDYISGCRSSGASKEVCSCTYDKLQSSYDSDVFEKIEKGYMPPDFMDKTIIAMQACVGAD